jgi:hypothetical protein
MQATIHMWVGSITLLLFLVATILYAIGIGGRAIPAAKYVSYLAALFLFIQYLLGIGLLFSGSRNKWFHYLFALLVIIPVGLEHGMIRRRFSGREQAMNLTLAAGAATVLVFIAYLIGQMNGS